MKHLLKAIKENLTLIKNIKKSPFLNLRKKYYFGILKYGTPYFYPWYFNPTILTITKGDIKFKRCKHFKLFNYNVYYGWPINISCNTLGWKEKYGTPRFEWSPAFYVHFFSLQFCIWWNPPFENFSNIKTMTVLDAYYEMYLWYKNYSDSNIEKAEKTWGWVDGETNKSTWNKTFLIINYELENE